MIRFCDDAGTLNGEVEQAFSVKEFGDVFGLRATAERPKPNSTSTGENDCMAQFTTP
jgi:hypothetical protein